MCFLRTFFGRGYFEILLPRICFNFFQHSELFKPNGKFIEEGDVIKRTKYGNTLKKIAKSGSADIFYTGSMAKQV